MNWNEVVIGIPTMPQRKQLLAELLERMRHEIRCPAIVVREHVPGTLPRVDLPELVSLTRKELRRWTLFVEDDVWPAPGFGRLALEALQLAEEHGFWAASLFSRSKRDLELLTAGKRWRTQAPSSFCMMQAVAVRSELLIGFADWAPSWYEAHPQHIHAADLLLGAWLSQQRARMLVHIPSLVQHRAVPSTLPGPRGVRMSETYRLAFGEVP